MPYFDRYVPRQAARHLPVDKRATAAQKKTVRTLADAIRFPSDPPGTRLEENHVAVLLRSDRLDHIADGAKTLFTELEDIFRVTSIRRGFVGGGFHGAKSLPKQMATAAGVPGADLIPDTAELFLGFTSTQKAGLGPARIANFETLGFVDLGSSGYFAHGTSMHLSHLYENLEAWYLNFDHRERVDTTFRPGLEVEEATLTVPQGPDDVQTPADVTADYHATLRIGHSGSIQTSSRLQTAFTGPDGTHYPAGTAVPQRADFNTLDNPFFWTRTARRIRSSRARGRTSFCRLQPVERRFRAQPAGDGRRAARRDEAPLRAELPRAGLQRGAPDDASSELPRTASRPSRVPARRATCMTDGSALTRGSTSPSRP